MMPGGPREAYEAVRPIFEAIAAQADGARCVAYLGAGSVRPLRQDGAQRHRVRADAADLREPTRCSSRGWVWTTAAIAAVFAEWQAGELESYLVEITAAIFRRADEQTGVSLVDLILGEAAQKGTGMWTSQHARWTCTCRCRTSTWP